MRQEVARPHFPGVGTQTLRTPSDPCQAVPWTLVANKAGAALALRGLLLQRRGKDNFKRPSGYKGRQSGRHRTAQALTGRSPRDVRAGLGLKDGQSSWSVRSPLGTEVACKEGSWEPW